MAASGWNGSEVVAQEEIKDGGRIEEIVVTATRRASSSQDIPVAITALGGQTLDDLDVDVFSDYLQQLPGVTSGGAGPGQNTIYIRGLASSTNILTTAGVAGLAPNVALYLDDQPLAQPGRNLDVYAVDLERVEVLSGPQGTLFGASSQAGTIRLITNKPKLGEVEAIANFGISFTQGGEMSTKVEGIINLPVTEKLAVRAVAYVDDQGGYIDNVPGTIDARQSARFRAAGTQRLNGVPVSAGRAGFQAGADLSGVNFISADNAGLVEEDINDTQYAGFRFSALYEINDDWRFTATHARQSIESDGVFFIDPDLDDPDELSIQRYQDDRIEDDFASTSWTLEGRIAELEMIYTGAYTTRETNQRVDYTDYLFVGQYLPYYICDSSVTYPGDNAPSGTCQAPDLFVDSLTDTEVMTHELRFNTPADARLRATFGGFYSELTLEERNDFTYPGSEFADVFGSLGFSDNFPNSSGFVSDNGPFPSGVIFRNDVRRTDQQFGLFGEVTYDLVPELLSVTFGARYYDVEVDLEGSANGSFCNSFQDDINAFGTDISDLYDGDGQFTFNGSCNPDLRTTFTQGATLAEITAATGQTGAGAERILNSLNAPDVASTDGFIFKGTVNFTPTENVLLFATYSEGFRPGLLNRPGGALGPDGFTVPFELETDEVQNYEIGWKTDLFDNQLRFNGSAFFVDIQNLQTSLFDPSIVNLVFAANTANAEIYGVEGDFIYAPKQIDGLTVYGAFSILDTEITDVLIPTQVVEEGQELAYAPGFSANFRVRYDFELADMEAYVMPQLVHTGEQQSDVIDINTATIDSWTTLGFSTGIAKDNWTVDLFIENITDERGQLSNNFANDRNRVFIIRPLTASLRFGYRF